MKFQRVTHIISRLLEFKGRDINIPLKDLLFIIKETTTVFKSQPMLLGIPEPDDVNLNICGDIHGQFTDLIDIFKTCGFPSDVDYLFLGDYVDRGKNSIESITLLFCFKLLYPSRFNLLRGNHECSSLSKQYGFYDECVRRYGNDTIWKSFTGCFEYMPVSAVVGKAIFCVHAGIPRTLNDLEDINNIERPVEIPDEGLLCDLLWSDPNLSNEPGWAPSERGVSYMYGPDVVKTFLEKHDLNLICRSHEAVEKGYEFFSDQSLVTIFSAKNYCGSYENNGGVMIVRKNLRCSFKIIKYEKK